MIAVALRDMMDRLPTKKPPVAYEGRKGSALPSI
jgi:hypothetical protein